MALGSTSYYKNNLLLSTRLPHITRITDVILLCKLIGNLLLILFSKESYKKILKFVSDRKTEEDQEKDYNYGYLLKLAERNKMRR